MDGPAFDRLSKHLATRQLTRTTALRGLVAGAVAGLTGWSPFAEEARADNNNDNNNGRRRRRRRRKNKKQLVCTCSGTGCTQQKVKKDQVNSLINQNSRCNYAGTCTTNPCATTQPLGCSPATNTQGSCLPGQLCSAQAICVTGCTTTTSGTQGSCPAGQICVIATGQSTGQCNGPVCSPACQPNQVCCPSGTASAGQCRGTVQAC